MAVCFKSVLGGGGGGKSMHVDTLTITTQPSKKIYIQGERIDTTGMIVTASAYGMSGTVTPYVTVSPQILSTAGTQTITVSFGDATATYTVTVEEIVSLSITSQPTKTEYIQGETLDLTGMVVTATSANLSRNITSSCTFSPANGSVLSSIGEITITASFGSMTTTTVVTAYAIESISVTTPPNKTTYAEDEALDLTGIVVSALANSGAITVNVTSQCTFSPANGTVFTEEGTYTITVTYESFTTTTNVVVETVTTLENTQWSKIKQIGSKGIGSQFWSVGDTKTIALNGTIGTVEFDNFQCKVFIIDFNYRGDNGIYFQGFMENTNPTNKIALIDDKYSQMIYDNSLLFNMNHYGVKSQSKMPTYGGWKGCDLRYDILGSTDVAPSEYGQIKTVANIGYDATSNCPLNPVSNTVMSALPSDLRAVLAPWIIYTDNVGNQSGNTDANVSTSIDYLPLLAEYELRGDGLQSEYYANTYEHADDRQKVISYYKNNHAGFKKYNNSSQTAYYWTRSPHAQWDYSFIRIEMGNSYGRTSSESLGIAPAFRVA